MFGKESVRAHSAKPSVVFKLLSKWIYITKIVRPACKCVASVGLTAASALQPALANDAFEFALGFNAFIGNEFSAVSSDVQGKLAAGGNITLASYGVSSVYRAEPQEDVLISGGNIQYQNGQIFAGSVLAAGSTAGIGSEVLSAMPQGSHVLSNSNLPFSFYDEFQALQDFSSQLSELTPTGTTEYKWGGTHLTGDCESETQVFNIDGNSLLNSNALVLNCTPETSTLLLNITGDHAGLKNIGLAHLSERATRTLYNFPEATSVELVWVGVEGTVLAPLAHFDNPRGSLNGTIIAKSWDGPMELHHVPFHGEFQGMQQRENQAPVYHSVPIVEAFTGTDYQYQIIVDDPDLDPITIAMVTSPEGMTLDPETGLILWRPSVEQPGNHPVVISATDGEATVLQEFSIAVSYSNSAPSIEPLSDISMQEGDVLEIPINATDREGDSLEYAASNLPNFATLENNVLKLQPGYDNSGYYADILISVTDGVFSAFESFSLEILDVNRAPQIISQPILSVLEGSLYTYPIVIQDPDINAVLSLALLQGPEGMSLDGDNNQLVWTPTAADIGDHEIKIEVADELGLSDDQAYTLQVVNINDAPILSDLSSEANEDEALQIVLVGLDVDGDTLSYELVSSPQNGTLSGEFPTISYTPHLNYFGEDHFSVISNDGIANSNIATVSITVLAINDAPTVSSDPILNVAENQLYQYQILGSDVDGDVLSYNAITELPSGASLSSEGLLSWIPDFSQAGEYAINIEVSDGELSYIHSFDLTVQNVNQAPYIAVIPEQTIAEGEELTITIDAVDPDGDSLTYSVEGLPSFAVLNGYTITFSPGFDDAGEYEDIKITVSDGASLSSRKFGIIVVNGNNPPQIVSSPPLVVVAGDRWEYEPEAIDPDGDVLSYEFTSDLNIRWEDGSMSWEPSADDIGEYELSVTVIDPSGAQHTQYFTLAVIAAERRQSHEGTEFWLPFTSNFKMDDSLFYIYLAAGDSSAIANIEIAAMGVSEQITLSAGEIKSFTVESEQVMAVGAVQRHKVLVDQAIHITADEKISVYAVNQREATTDGFLALPNAVLGTSYIVGHYTTLASGNYSDTQVSSYGNGSARAPQVGIVATEDNTEVLIDATMDLFSGAEEIHGKIHIQKGERFALNLDQGDVYYLEARGSKVADLTGTMVSSNKKIAVFGTHSCANVPQDAGACDHLVEQLPPIDSLGTEYFTAPTYGRGEIDSTDNSQSGSPNGGDVFRIIAPFGSTRIYIDGDYKYLLNAQEFVEFIESSPQRIITSKPVLLIQYAVGDSMDSNNPSRILEATMADPFMVVVPPSAQYMKHYNVRTPDRDLVYNFINVVIPTNSIDSFQMNAEFVEPSFFSPIGNSDFSYAQLSVQPGSHELMANEPFGITVYGNDFYESYGYLGGMALSVPEAVSTISIVGDENLNVGNTACVAALITDHMEWPVSGVRIEFTVSGNHDHTGYAFSDSRGVAEYCYLGAVTGDDFISAAVNGLQSTTNITWSASTENLSPRITSYPELRYTPNETYEYQIETFDANGDEVTLQLVNPSDDPEASLVGNVLTWHPTSLGEEKRFVLKATDEHGLSEQQSFVLTPSHIFNSKPVFTTLEPGGLAVQGVPYIYNPEFSGSSANQTYLYQYYIDTVDVDGDGRRITLVEGPPEATIKLQTIEGDPLCISESCNHIINWVPANTGTYNLTFGLRDFRGAEAESQTISVKVDPNYPPVIVSQPPSTKAVAGKQFKYILDVENDVPLWNKENPDNLRVEFDVAPSGMSELSAESVLDNKAALNIAWTPTVGDIGIHTVRFRVLDQLNASEYQEFTLEVIPENNFPVFTSGLMPNAEVNIAYEHQLAATDPDGDSIKYMLIAAPSDMTMNGTGLITWLPGEEFEGGRIAIWYAIDDGRGGLVYKQDYINVNAFTNRAPQFLSGYRPKTAKVGVEYFYQALATDREGDLPISYRKGSYDPGAIDSATGEIRWVPESLGNYRFYVAATDSLGNFASSNSISWNVEVIPENAEFDFDFSWQPSNVVEIGESTAMQLVSINEASSVTATIRVDGEEYVIDDLLRAEFTGTKVGVTDIEITLTDGYETVVKKTNLVVPDPSDISDPSVQIDFPQDGAVITSPSMVLGTVQDETLTSVTLLYKRADQSDTEYRVLYHGIEDLDNRALAEFDPTLLVNGSYHLLLQAEDSNGRMSGHRVAIIVEGDQKLGNFSFTVEDLNIPIEGIPVVVSRTYDSRRKLETMGFGYGWTIDYQNVRIEESREPTTGWTRYTQKADFPGAGGASFVGDAVCSQPVGEKIVTITLPNGKVEKFGVYAEPSDSAAQSISIPNCFLSGGSRFHNLRFRPMGGTYSTLTAEDVDSLYLSEVTNGFLEKVAGDGQPFNVHRYTLTTKAGYIYKLDQNFGVETIAEPNGHAITYSDTGIVHSSGKSISFVRDGDGRITQITDPSNNVYEYIYDANGDLVEFRNAEQVMQDIPGTEYVYNNDHSLLDIFDPLGRTVVKNLYDDTGRLYAQNDGQGNIKTFNHDLDSNTSVVTDRDWRTTVYQYDDRGNVLFETQSIGDGSYTSDIVTSYTYDDKDNQLTKSVAGSEYVWTSHYDEDSNLSYTVDAEQNRVDYLAYNRFGQETQIEDELNRITTMHYDSQGNLTGISMPGVLDPDSGETLVYNAANVYTNGRVTSSTNLRGLTTVYTYYLSGPAAGQKWTESSPDSGTITYTYDANNNIDLETRERTVNGEVLLETVDYDYDSLNRLTKTTYPDDSYTETVYDPAGNLDKERDRFGVWTDYTYNAYGRLTDTLYADGTTEVRSYTPEGLLETVTDRSRHTTRYDYDDAGRQRKITYHDQSYTETRYTPQGWVEFEWDENRNLTEYEYDLAGKRKAVIRHYTDAAGNPQQQRHSFTYYDNGELHTETDANNYTTTYVINALDQRIETQFENGTSAQTRYDAMGARTRSIDQNTRATDYRYDDLGRLEEIQPDITIEGQRVPITSYTYDEVGNKLSQTDANNHSTSWTYDYFGRVLSRTLPEQMTEYFVYDDTVRTRTHTDFNGQVSVTQFNNLGQVETVSYDNGTSESYTYWPNGQIRQVTDKNGVTNYVYDDRDRIDHEIQSDGTRLDYDYDDAGNRTLVEITRDDTVVSSTSYTYDGLNRLETVTDTNGTTRYTYDAVGNLDTVTYPNGIVEEYDYNDVNQLAVLTVRDASQNVIGSYTYALDYTGRRESITEAGGRFTDFKYDDLYRLTDEIITDNLAGNHTANYQYDWVGNRTYETVNGVETLYLYDDNDRLEQQGGTVYGYDDNGNLITETLDGVTTTYHYDERNKLIQLEAAEATTEYTYNHNGIRTSKTQGGVATQYIVDANRDYAQVLLETGDTQDVFYTYGHDLISQLRENTPSFYIYDGLGSTRALSDSVGAISDTYDYEVFGELLNQTGATENDYLFTGEQFDRSVDQYYLRARYYDQGIGRFTQMDTWMGDSENPITLNKYIYANADAVNGIDPSGNMTLNQTMVGIGGLAILGTIAINSYNNAMSLDRADAPGFDGTFTDRELGVIALLALGSSSPGLLRMVLGSEEEVNDYYRIEDDLQAEVNRLRESGSISVPRPPRKRGWFTCIARAQDLSRTVGGSPTFGWGWGLSRDFQTAKNAAVQMANSSIGAIDTHHAQWRCLAPDGTVRRP
ncbi:choice-of-anchor A family protein [Teredinibacter turnerae]|uniref:choice-of-anchor A family protein n=1 Tax=Teredinibacter turnerae TaxID=2426 RepID=UPI00035DAFFC|nr:choice-of-anchor A family protein [Teredinibacter turnerae]